MRMATVRITVSLMIAGVLAAEPRCDFTEEYFLILY